MKKPARKQLKPRSLSSAEIEAAGGGAYIRFGYVQCETCGSTFEDEVYFEGHGWVPFDPTPDEDQEPNDQTTTPRANPKPQVLQPPPTAQEPADLPPMLASDREQEDDEPSGFEWLGARSFFGSHSYFMSSLDFWLKERPILPRLRRLIVRAAFSVPSRLLLAPFFWLADRRLRTTTMTLFARRCER